MIDSELLIGIPAILLLATLTVLFLRTESRLLLFVLFAFAFVARTEPGFQIQEIIFAVLFFGFLLYWFLSRSLDPQARIVREPTDLSLLLFLLYVPLTAVLSLLNSAEPNQWISEWIVLATLALYFPARAYCATTDTGRIAIVGMMLWIAGYVLFRNFYWFSIELGEAEYLWEIATTRVPENEHLLMIAGIGSAVWYSMAGERSHRVVAFLATALFSVGVLIGQSRAVWVSYALGIAIVVLVSPRNAKRRIVTALGITVVTGLAIGFIVVPDIMKLFTIGIVDRVASLGSASTQDLSLVNRFQENRGVLEYIIRNPIVGYGLGSPYRYYSLVNESTRYTSFVHSWYFGMLYRHGIIGALLFFPTLFAAIIRGFRIHRNHLHTQATRSIALFVSAALVAEMLAATTETTFGTSDKTLFLALMFALVFSVPLSRRTINNRD